MFLKMLAFFAATSWVAWMLMFMGFQTKRESRQRSETEHTRTAGTIIDYARGEHLSGRRDPPEPQRGDRQDLPASRKGERALLGVPQADLHRPCA